MEPSPRWYHCSAAIDCKLYVWGGRTKDFAKEKTTPSTLSAHLHIFDPFTESWETKSTTGAPLPLYRSASASAGHHLYQYGGYDELTDCDSFYHLDTTTLRWKQLPNGDVMSLRKSSCRMITSGDHLVLFGGYGVSTGPAQEGAQFIKRSESNRGAGWTNEFHAYDQNGELSAITLSRKVWPDTQYNSSQVLECGPLL